ncbi:amino acid adenylation domain-containing protein [Wukongibacter sp. M2B1]|uniref:type I polyketide synthase n=1 Tax=Wukongibacter sp. M2B1 TaxID=3088895 RepID=UPI003D79456D
MNNNNLVEIIFKSIISGKIEKETGAKLLKELKNNSSDDDIAIIGIGLNLPMAKDTHEFWQNMRNGIDSIRDFPLNRRNDIDKYLDYIDYYKEKRNYSTGAYLEEIDKFDYSFFRLSPKEASLMSPNQRLFLETAWNTIEDAGYTKEKMAGTKTGIYIGFSGDELFDYKKLIMDVEPDELSAALPGNLSSIIAGRIAYFLDLKGPSMLIDTACSSSLVSVHMACQSLRTKECEMAIAGGVRINLLKIKGDIDIGIQASDGKTRSFDDNSEGTGCGEGVAAVLLKPLKKAIMDKDNIYAVIKASSVNQDGNSIGVTAPNVIAQENVISSAWEKAKINPETISYIEAHGTGTNLGDPIEIEGINRAFSRYTNKKQFCAVGSVKTNIGHLDQASGIVGLIKAALALKNKELPPMLHFNRPNRKIDFENSPLYICDELVKWEPEHGIRRCGVSSFGISGTNCHIILEEMMDENTSAAEDVESQKIFTLSAKSKNSLKQLVARYKLYIEREEEFDIRDLCYTSNTGRNFYRYRLALLVRDHHDFMQKINRLRDLEVDEYSRESEEIFYDEFKIVAAHKENKQAFEVTREEQQRLTTCANEILEARKDRSLLSKRQFKELCRLFVKGGKVSWDRLYQGENRKKISLPAYQFENKRCWIDVPKLAEEIDQVESPLNVRSWELKAIKEQNKTLGKASVLIFKDKLGKGNEVKNRLSRENIDVFEVSIDKKFERISEYEYRISNNLEDYKYLFEELKEKGITHILHMWTLESHKQVDSIQKLDESLRLGIYSLFYMTQAINEAGIDEDIQIILISQNVDRVTNKESIIQPENAPLFGLGKVIRWEHPNLKIRTIDFDEDCGIEHIISEMSCIENPNYRVAYRDGKRYIEVVEKLDIKGKMYNKLSVEENGAYIITGGTGAIGLKMAKYLALKGAKRLALISRSKMPPRNLWDEIIKNGEDIKLCRRISKIREIEAEGAFVNFYSADVSSLDMMRDVIEAIRNEFGKINGVIHGAGSGDGTLVGIEREESVESTLAPKIYGTWIIDYLTKEDKLEFFIMFSSAITLVGGLGGGSYTAANAYLNSFGALRNTRGDKALSINWPVWYETGLSEGVDSHEEKQLFKIISPEKAMDSFDKVINSKIENEIIIGEVNYDSSLFDFEDELPFNLSEGIKSKIVRKKDSKNRKKKISRRKLHSTKTTGKEEAYTECEIKLADIWGEVLGLDEINVYDNFYELGGDSLIATRIINLINRRMNIALEIQDFFKFLNICDLGKCLEEKYLSGKEVVSIYANIPRVEDKEHYILSSAQKRIFVLSQMEKDAIHYNEPAVMKIKGRLDREKFEYAISKLIERHEALRTSFQMIDGEPVQRVAKDLKLDINYIDSNKEDLEGLIHSFIKPFDLSKAPLMRVSLVTLLHDEYFLIFDMHHIICDGTSMHILLQDFISLYEGRMLQELRIQYKDFALWQEGILNGELIKKQEDYWMNIFQGNIPHMDLATDYPRPVEQSFEGDNVKLVIDAALSKKINKLASENGATLYMTLLAAFNVLLSKYTNNEDIVIGSPIEGRHNADLSNIMGIFINTLAMRNKPKSDKTFKEFLNEVKENALKAYENQDFQFEKLIEKLAIDRDLSRNPMFDVMFALHYYSKDRSIEVGDMEFSPVEFENKVSKFDLSLIAVENDGQIYLEFQYCTSLFRHQTIENMTVYFETLLREISKDAARKIKDLKIISESEKKKLLIDFNATEKKYINDKTICQMFEEQAAKKPQNIALILEDDKCSYIELNNRANQIAKVLRNKGVGPGTIVGIMAERSIEMMFGIFGIMKAGAAYLPIDPHYPEQRKKYIFEDSGINILLTQKRFMEDVEYSIETLDLEDKNLYIDDVENPQYMNRMEDAAYVIYTSGSTGKPKGVIIEHRALANRINWMQKEYMLMETDVILQKTPITFDVSVWELFWWSTQGAALTMLAPGGEKEPQKIIDAVHGSKVTVMHFVPSMLNIFFEYIGVFSEEVDKLKSLNRIFTSGEELKTKHLNAFNNILANRYKTRLSNLYGPTEATIDVSYFNCSKEHDSHAIPIGKPIDNIKLYILDKDNNPKPIGVPGELCIAGVGLARGYLNRPKLTNEKFVDNPFDQGERMYRTGDLAKWNNEGNIEFLGRLDYQVKIRGNRIEIGEVESRLLEHEYIKNVVVVALDDENDNKYLCAYFVAAVEIVISEIREHLVQRLPDYMIPSYFVQLEEMPLTPNGKVNRSQLPRPDKSINNKESFAKAKNIEEQVLVNIWQEVLGIEKISVSDNFFLLGGDSIKAIQIIAKLKQKGFRLEMKDLFKNPKISNLAKHIQVDNRKINQGIVQGEVQLSPIQKWFFEHRLTDSHYWNQAVHMYRENGFDEKAIKKVFEILVQHHDALRMIYIEEEGNITQLNRGLSEELFGLNVFEVGMGFSVEDVMKKEIEKGQSVVDLNKGPLVNLYLFKTDTGDYLSIVIHHLVIDGVSWRILIEDFKTAYNQVNSNEEILIPEKTDSYKAWTEKISDYAKHKKTLNELEYWANLKGETVVLNKDFSVMKSQKKLKDNEFVSVSLSKEDTEKLLSKVNKAYNTETIEILLTALGLALEEVTKQNKILINLEGHGREEMLDSICISRTIGWFTSLYPVLLDVSNNNELSYSIKAAKENIRRIPNRGFNYGILKYNSSLDDEVSMSNFKSEPEICFNYLGQFGKTAEDDSFEIIDMANINSMSSNAEMLYAMEINSMIIKKQLEIRFTYNKNEFRRETIEDYSNQYIKKLNEIIKHCMDKQFTESTPSDLGDNDLSLEDLEQIKSVFEG